MLVVAAVAKVEASWGAVLVALYTGAAGLLAFCGRRP